MSFLSCVENRPSTILLHLTLFYASRASVYQLSSLIEHLIFHRYPPGVPWHTTSPFTLDSTLRPAAQIFPWWLSDPSLVPFANLQGWSGLIGIPDLLVLAFSILVLMSWYVPPVLSTKLPKSSWLSSASVERHHIGLPRVNLEANFRSFCF